jgi:hypothetical protein
MLILLLLLLLLLLHRLLAVLWEQGVEGGQDRVHLPRLEAVVAREGDGRVVQLVRGEEGDEVVEEIGWRGGGGGGGEVGRC